MKKCIFSIFMIVVLSISVLSFTPGCVTTKDGNKDEIVNTAMDIGKTLLSAYINYRAMGSNSEAFENALVNAAVMYTGSNDDAQASVTSDEELTKAVNRVIEILETLKR